MRTQGSAGFLERVLALRCEEVAFRSRATPGSELRRRAAGQPARDFRAALQSAPGHAPWPAERIIAEVKRRSPRVAAYRQQGDAADLARVYARGGAAAVSIVTDEVNFGTSLADVARVRAAVPLPVLVKDFIVDAYQVLEARAAGADAVLLIARALAPGILAELLALVRELGICALVECHGEADLERALAAGADTIGVNSRDLSTLEVSLAGARRLLGRVPAGALRVAESGIASRQDVLALREAGADAFLVGGVLLQAAAPDAALGELLGGPHGGKP